MQYFVGLSEFTDKPIFDPTLFVTIRKLLVHSDFNDMSVSLLEMQVEKYRVAAKAKPDERDDFPSGSASDTTEDVEFTDTLGRLHKGSLKIDATCADAEIRYPTDIDLLHDGCKVINRYIDKLCRNFNLVHPTTHYRVARSAYLEVIKLKKRSKKVLRKGKSLLLTYLIHDLRSFIDLIGINGTHLFESLSRYEQKIAGAIIKMYYHSRDAYNESADLALQIGAISTFAC